MDALNNRELALLIWVSLGLLWCLWRPEVRPSLLDVVKSFLNPKIIVPLIAMIAYVVLEVWLGLQVGLWEPSLMKETMFWFITSGVLIFFDLDKASTQPKYFRKRVFDAFKIVVFIEVFVNLFVLSFPAELVLQPVLFLIAAMSAVSAQKKEHQQVKKLMDALLAGIGMFFLFFALANLYREWDNLNKLNLLRQLLLPVWLSIGLLPFMYVFSMIASYETAFMRIDATTKNHHKRFNAKLALIVGLNFRIRRLSSLRLSSLDKLTSADSLSDALSVVRSHKNSESGSRVTRQG